MMQERRFIHLLMPKTELLKSKQGADKDRRNYLDLSSFWLIKNGIPIKHTNRNQKCSTNTY